MEATSAHNNDEDNNEMELSLELSIGRKSYKKSSSSSSSFCPKIDAHLMNGLERSGLTRKDPGPGQETKRGGEIQQGLRRQEAKKKREDHKIKICSKGNGKKGKFCTVKKVNFDEDGDDDVVLEIEEEAETPLKKEENGNGTTFLGQNLEGGGLKDLKLALNTGNNIGTNSMGQQMQQYPYRPGIQYVPFTNGFVYPYGVVPCWGPLTAGNNGNVSCGNEGEVSKKKKRVNLGNEWPEKEKKVSFEPSAACRSFRPYNKVLEQNGSSGGSSSAISDYQNSSLQGATNSDTGSSSSKFSQKSLNATSAGNQHEEKSENNADSGMKPNEAEEKTAKNHITEMISPSMHQSTETKRNEELKSATEQTEPRNQPVLSTPNQPVLSTQNPNAPAQLKEEAPTVAISKPPIPPTEQHGAPSLPQMPCVSTTGNGPNGKTINGFLYRYTKTEVSIVCVCHGTSFSPAEFVEHAGGVDVAHPLRHITVIPSAFA